METISETEQQLDAQTTSSEEDFDDGFIQMLVGHLEKKQDLESGCEKDYDDEKEMEPGTSQAEQGSPSVASRKARPPTAWELSLYISKWKRAHGIGHHINLLTTDPSRKALISEHEKQCKTSIPLPIVGLLEEEALQILKETEKEYMLHFGPTHPLTLEVQQNMERLEAQVTAKEGNRLVAGEKWWWRVVRWGRTLISRLRGSWGLG